MEWFLFPALALLVALVVVSGKAVRLKAAALSLLLLALSGWWLVDRLSGDGLNAAALYHMQSNLEGAGVGDFKGDIAVFLALAALSLSALLLPRVRRFRLRAHGGAVLAAFAVALLGTAAVSPLAGDAVRLVHRLQPVDYRAVAGEYVRVAQPVRRPRNVVWIYGESLERTYLDDRAFPGLMPNLARLATQGIDVRDLAQVEGTGWTIAGMVASMCGVPLTTAPGDENSMGRMGSFLPEAECLGDYLRRQGYATEFVGGADAAFAGKGAFLRSHGFDDVKDQAWFRAQGVDAARFSQWGVHDDVLLDTAWDSFERLSRAADANGKPFLLTALTMDTHHPAGHLPRSCRGQTYDSRYGDIGLLHALKCSDRLIGAFVDRIRNSPWAEDTLIVVSSDHLAMPNDLTDVLAGLHRENLLLFLGEDIAPRRLVADRGTTLDTGATLLQLLEPSVQALGFGRSLLAPQARASASVAARSGEDGDYRRYLAFSRSLWTGEATRTLRMDAGARVAIGRQRIQPPVLLQYDRDWNLTAITLEDSAIRELPRTAPEHAAVYVQRCTAFEDAALDGEWCALLVDGEHGARLIGDAQLRRGLRVDQAAGRPARYGAQARTPVTVAHRIEKPGPGRYLLELWTGQQPSQPYWVEAVSEREGRVLSTHWVQPDASGRIQLPLALEQPVEAVRLRAWVDQGQHFTVGKHALLPLRTVAESRKPAAPATGAPATGASTTGASTTGASGHTSRSRG